MHKGDIFDVHPEGHPTFRACALEDMVYKGPSDDRILVIDLDTGINRYVRIGNCCLRVGNVFEMENKS